MTTQLGEGLTLHTDFYELNMMNTFFEQGISERNAVFEVFFGIYRLVRGLLFLRDWNM